MSAEKFIRCCYTDLPHLSTVKTLQLTCQPCFSETVESEGDGVWQQRISIIIYQSDAESQRKRTRKRSKIASTKRSRGLNQTTLFIFIVFEGKIFVALIHIKLTLYHLTSEPTMLRALWSTTVVWVRNSSF